MTCKNYLVFHVRKCDHKTVKWKTKIVKTLWKVILQCYYWYVTYYASEEATSKHTRDYPFSSSRLTAI